PFDGLNYSYWKDRMRIFLKSIDESVWQATMTQWIPPMMELVAENGTTSMKEISYIFWMTTEKSESSANAKARNVITCALPLDEFKKIISCD
ncbi:hypothetical protein PJP10_31780, partial [Mycobacterium kansasii]